MPFRGLRERPRRALGLRAAIDLLWELGSRMRPRGSTRWSRRCAMTSPRGAGESSPLASVAPESSPRRRPTAPRAKQARGRRGILTVSEETGQSERSRVGDTGQLSRRVEVGSLCTRFGVGHGDRVLDVRESPVEDPEVTVECPTVDDLDHELDVVVAEKPKVSGIRRGRDGLAAAGGSETRSAPGDSYEETACIETEARGIRPAQCDLPRCRSRFRCDLAADSVDHERSRVRNAREPSLGIPVRAYASRL